MKTKLEQVRGPNPDRPENVCKWTNRLHEWH